jgi:hypothetical protein
MAFCCGLKAATEMSFEVCVGSPSFAAPRRNCSSFVPIGAVCTGKVCSTHS